MIEHNFKKKFGQNFISDKNLLNAICDDGNIDEQSEVLEIGAGGGSLTQALSSRAKKVVSYEIDGELKEHLQSLGLKNTKFVFKDIMKCPLEEIESDFEGEYSLVANLPYYITSPIISKFLKSKKISSLTIMVQKEVAERICAKVNDADYGFLSILVAFYGEPTLKRTVSKNMFYPRPKVDSAIVNIKIAPNRHKNIDEEKFFEFLASAFSMRRKTLRNNLLHADITAEKINMLDKKTLEKRPQEFSLEEFIAIFQKIFE